MDVGMEFGSTAFLEFKLPIVSYIVFRWFLLWFLVFKVFIGFW